jgi:hypothetical protein
MTRGILQGDVTVAAPEGRGSFEVRLDVVAPLIDNYRYGVLTAHHGVQLYPVTVRRVFETVKPLQCPDESALESALGEILSSPNPYGAP